MAKKRSHRQPSAAGRHGVQPTVVVQGDGRALVTVDLAQADLPELSFYANALTTTRFDHVVSYYFGQMAQFASEQPLSAIVRVDVPVFAMGEVVKSFAPLRDRVAQLDASNPPVAPVSSAAKTAFAYPAQAVGLLVNDHMTVIDFYQLVPVRGGIFELTAAIRITGMPQLAVAFINQSDKLAEA
ncbi:MAG: hypothetical protein JNK64_07525 [Myxococcales bacterium]|nr:hypothetical protein [Myxococcales bacterium]